MSLVTVWFRDFLIHDERKWPIGGGGWRIGIPCGISRIGSCFRVPFVDKFYTGTPKNGWFSTRLSTRTSSSIGNRLGKGIISLGPFVHLPCPCWNRNFICNSCRVGTLILESWYHLSRGLTVPSIVSNTKRIYHFHANFKVECISSRFDLVLAVEEKICTLGTV